jgi:hypothetical protein
VSGVKKMNRKEDLIQLDILCKSDLSSFYYGYGKYTSQNQIGNICFMISNVVEYFLNENNVIDLRNSAVINFLRNTLPILTEVLLRRKNAR